MCYEIRISIDAPILRNKELSVQCEIHLRIANLMKRGRFQIEFFNSRIEIVLLEYVYICYEIYISIDVQILSNQEANLQSENKLCLANIL